MELGLNRKSSEWYCVRFMSACGSRLCVCVFQFISILHFAFDFGNGIMHPFYINIFFIGFSTVNAIVLRRVLG